MWKLFTTLADFERQYPSYTVVLFFIFLISRTTEICTPVVNRAHGAYETPTGHTFISDYNLCIPGYRHIKLKSDCNQALCLPVLFVYIVTADYVPSGFSGMYMNVCREYQADKYRLSHEWWGDIIFITRGRILQLSRASDGQLWYCHQSDPTDITEPIMW